MRLKVGNGKRGQVVRLPLLDVVNAVYETLAEPSSFPGAEWAPADPDHDTMQKKPLPLEPWVRAGFVRDNGHGCDLCGGYHADTLTRIDGRLVLVHDACLRRKPSEAETKRNERLAKIEAWRRGGFPPAPHAYTGTHTTGDPGPAQKDDA